MMRHIYKTVLVMALLFVGCMGCGNKERQNLSFLEAKKTSDNEATKHDNNSRLIIIKAGDIDLSEQKGAAPSFVITSWVYYYICENSNDLLTVTVRKDGTSVTRNKIPTTLTKKWVRLDSIKIDTVDIAHAILESARSLFIYGVTFQVESLTEGSAINMRYGEGNSGPFVTGVTGNIKLVGSKFAPCNFSIFNIETGAFTGPIIWTPFVDKNRNVIIIDGRNGSLVKVEKHIIKSLNSFLSAYGELLNIVGTV